MSRWFRSANGKEGGSIIASRAGSQAAPCAADFRGQGRQREGFFLKVWQAGLAEYDEMEGIAWKWQSIDGATGKAPLATECMGPNPTDREKRVASEVY